MNELRAFRGLMILVFSDWWLPWSPTVLATDASEEGFAVAQSEWDLQAVRDCGRTLEKSRWRMGAAQSRDHAKLAGGVDFETHAVVDEERANSPMRRGKTFAVEIRSGLSSK